MLALAWVGVASLLAWAVAALAIDVRIPWLRLPLAAALLLGAVAAAVFVRPPWLAMLACVGAFGVVLGWWLLLLPSNDRPWQPDRAVLPWAEIVGNRVTLHNVRNCGYRTEKDYDVRHDTRFYDLDALRTVDAYVVNWGSPWIAHTMLTFGFDGGKFLCVSIETRNEAGEGYSAIKGFFRQYELTYVFADERDVVRLRTNYRQGEEVYLYRLRMTPERARSLFLEYLRQANALRDHPRWYNAATQNCTTSIRLNADAARGSRSPFDWRILLNGSIDGLLAERGALAADLPFTEYQRRSHINAAARAADGADFSHRIREGLPGMSGMDKTP
jgi:hypothetical protein